MTHAAPLPGRRQLRAGALAVHGALRRAVVRREEPQWRQSRRAGCLDTRRRRTRQQDLFVLRVRVRPQRESASTWPCRVRGQLVTMRRDHGAATSRCPARLPGRGHAVGRNRPQGPGSPREPGASGAVHRGGRPALVRPARSLAGSHRPARRRSPCSSPSRPGSAAAGRRPGRDGRGPPSDGGRLAGDDAARGYLARGGCSAAPGPAAGRAGGPLPAGGGPLNHGDRDGRVAAAAPPPVCSAAVRRHVVLGRPGAIVVVAPSPATRLRAARALRPSSPDSRRPRPAALPELVYSVEIILPARFPHGASARPAVAAGRAGDAGDAAVTHPVPRCAGSS